MREAKFLQGLRHGAILFQRFLNRLVLLVSGAALITMVAVISYMVFTRYVLGFSPLWGHELALICMVWFALLSPAVALKENRHITVTVIDFIVPKSIVAALRVLAGIVILFFTLVMAVQGIEITELSARTTMSGSGLPRSVVYAAVPTSGLLMFLMFLARIVGGNEEPDRASTTSGTTQEAVSVKGENQ